jgi:hypothetical protein
MITTKGKGLAGPGVFVDFAGGKGDRTRNVVVTGAVGKVKFFMKPSWQVTLAPRTVLELDAAESDALKGAPPRVKLLRGAMMCEERPGATPSRSRDIATPFTATSRSCSPRPAAPARPTRTPRSPARCAT